MTPDGGVEIAYPAQVGGVDITRCVMEALGILDSYKRLDSKNRP